MAPVQNPVSPTPVVSPPSLPRAGFSLIEILVALTILLMTVLVIGGGLIGVVQLETDTDAQAELAAVARFVSARRLEGAEEADIRTEMAERWPEAELTVVERRDEEDRTWEWWTLETGDGHRLRLEYPLTLVPE